MEEKSAMEEAAKEGMLNQRRREVFEEIVDSLQNLGYQANLFEDVLFGPGVKVESESDRDEFKLILGEPDEFDVTEDSREALEITKPKGKIFRFRSDRLLELSSRGGLFEADIDFT